MTYFFHYMRKTRVSATIPEEILRRFDEVCKDLGHKNRSSAISTALYEYIVSNKWIKKKGNIAGAIIITYDHHTRNINEMLTEVQHEYNDIINASLHIHLTHEQCLEIVAVRGEANKIRKLFKNLQSIKGIFSIKFVASA
ncbi:MAG: nickel-responsive transcriptional regulator NikR [Thermoplasmata archaeon]|nr:MAG: nickel-responsive transcriptional regulator NikR [Thermoplasmata archaeon]